jgi:hypothetical protein
MRKVTLVFALVLGISSHVLAATCTSTGFIRDSINMTAAMINPTGTVTGTVDATGCNIGIYYDGGHDAKVSADVFGSNYFGVVVNTDNTLTSSVSIKKSIVHHIGEVPHNGTQHGVGIYLRGLAGSINGVVDTNWIFDYQKNGIAAVGPGVDVDVTNNTVTGDGHVSFIAQNGIEMAFGVSNNSISGNYVYGNSYIGFQLSSGTVVGGDGSSSAGILVAGGPAFSSGYDTNIRIKDNVLVANDVGVFSYNADASLNPAATPTNVAILNNVIYGDICYNQSYQAGISDTGNSDRIVGNTVYGPGYSSACIGQILSPPQDANSGKQIGFAIDVSDTTNPTVKNNPHRGPLVRDDE